MKATLVATVALAVAVVLATPRDAQACPRGYESRVRLVKGAHHIAEVEVLSTEDLRITTDDHGLDPGGTRTFERAVARVRVVSEARGHLPVREFTLVGGPYDSCAPYLRLLRFDAGSRLRLVLAAAVPEGTKEVTVSWRCRVARADGEDLATVVGVGAAAWRRRLARMRRVAPAALDAATSLAAARGADGDWPAPALRALAYPVLAGLAELERDPTRPWRPDAHERAPTEPSTSYDAGREHGTPYPPHLADELQRRLGEPGPERDAAVAFHRRLLASLLEDELGQPATRAARFVAAAADADLACEVAPADGIETYDRDDGELRSVSLLLELASDEPDGLVWSMVDAAELEPSVFEPWLTAHVRELPEAGPYLDLLLATRLRAASPYVERVFAEAGDSWRMDSFLRFFVGVGDGAHADEVVARLARLADGARSPSDDADERASLEDHARWAVGEAREAMVAAGPRGAPYLARLDALLARLGK